MLSIENNSLYQLSVDQGKNRIYLEIRGAWNAIEQVPKYITHLKMALATVVPGFSIITDIREMGEYSLQIHEMHVDAQKITIAAGISQLAEIHKLHDPVSDQAIALASESNISLNIFESLEEAEAWLNDLG